MNLFAPNRHFLKASYGNDSIALIQWAHERQLPNVTVIYSVTGWAASNWAERVERGESLARSYGFEPVRLESIGFEPLLYRKDRKEPPT